MSRKKNAVVQTRLTAYHLQGPVELWSRPGPRLRASREWTWRQAIDETEAQTQAARQALEDTGWKLEGVVRPRGES